MKVVLCHKSGPNKGERFVLTEDIAILGKSADCDVRIPSTYVSRQHCQITRTGQFVVVHDLSSKNGTFLNGRRVVSEAVLNHGDELSLGRIPFAVLLGDRVEEHAEHDGKEATDYVTILPSLVETIERHEPLFHGHAERICALTQQLADAMGVDPYESENLIAAASLANLAMPYVPQEILYATETLTKDQWFEIKQHPDEAVRILKDSILHPDIVAGIRHHHERYDGSGYPDGLSHGDIPWISRVVAVAESIVAMRSDRPYRKALVLEEIRREIQHHAGLLFDPEVAAAAVTLLQSQVEEI